MISGRSLTAGEITLAQSMFQDAIAYRLVSIHDEKYVFLQPANSGMTPNGRIYVDGVYSVDYSTESPQQQAFFIHEMTHVWQHQNKILAIGVIGSAILEIIRRLGDYDSAYPYLLDSSKDLTDYNLEQQAAIVEDYFRLTKLGLLPRRAQFLYSPASALHPSGAPTRQLYETVLHKFLRDPSYGQSGHRHTGY